MFRSLVFAWFCFDIIPQERFCSEVEWDVSNEQKDDIRSLMLFVRLLMFLMALSLRLCLCFSLGLGL